MARPKVAKGKGKAPSIASGKPKSATQSTQNDVLPSTECPATPLKETSGNRLKRSRGTLEKDSDPYENTPSPKRTPTPTLFTAKEYHEHRQKHPIRPYKERRVTGKYTLVSCRSDSGHHVDTTGFEVKVYYDCRGEERYLYATFKFDKLEGIIRPRGHLPMDMESRRLSAAEYDQACALPSKDWPSRGRGEYSSRWRGKECGEHIIDGELGHVFEITAEKTTSPNGFPDMKILFDILYDDEIFHLEGMKTADLDSTDMERTYGLEKEWHALSDPRPEAKFRVEWEWQTECWRERKRMFPENRKRKAEYHPFSNGSRPSTGLPLKALRQFPDKTKTKKTAVWNVSGRYRLFCTNRLDPLDAGDSCFELHHVTQPYGQLFATFELGTLRGVMRLCPEKGLTSSMSKSLSEAGFENACRIDENTRPGPTNRSWLSRWRAHDGETLKGGETRAQGQFTIKQGRLEPGNPETVFSIAFVMVIDGKHLTFEGTHAAELDPPSPPFDLMKEWQELLDPRWEAGGMPTPYQPGSIIQIKHKQTPISGATVVQERPDWAWDITGAWKLTVDDEFLDTIEMPTGTPLTISIFLANNPRHTKIGRQYWAILKIGTSFEGCMRFCMPNKFGSSWTTAQFEDACKLNDGEWVGPRPRGSPKMEYRWRAKDRSTGFKPAWVTDEHHQGLTFKMGRDSKLTFSAVMTVSLQPMLLNGVKTGDIEPRKSNAATVKTFWDSFTDMKDPKTI